MGEARGCYKHDVRAASSEFHKDEKRNKKVKNFLFFSAAVLSAFLFAGCGKTAKAPSGDTIVFSSIGEPSYLNPLLATDSASGDINGFVFNGLTKYDKDLKITGDLAESWDVTPDGLTIVFHLRKNVLWHDGKPFTSRDVLFTYEKLVDPKVLTPFSSDYKRIASVRIPDDYTVKVKYKEPFAPALESWGIGIIPEHIFSKGDFNKNPANRKPIGTGPYRFVRWDPGEKIILEKNENYFEKTGNISRIVYRIIPDATVQFLELKKQAIDIMGLTPYQYKFEATGKLFDRFYKKFNYPSFSYTYLGFNLKNLLFRDKKVRQAIAYAIDKKAIIGAVLQGEGVPISAPYPPTSWAYNPNVKKYPHNSEKAKILLEKAGWRDRDGDGIREKDGRKFSFTVLTNQGNKMREECATIIQDELKKVGIEMKIRILEWASFIHQYIDPRKFEAVILGWSLSRDPDQFSIWHSSEMRKGGYNFVSYSNPEVDRLLAEGRRTFDIEKRKKIYFRLQEILADDQPYCFLYVGNSLPAVHSRFRGVAVAPAGIMYNFVKWRVPENLIKYK
ncbi:MAG: peptide-binding protein [Elusimicrobia bacterium]|nr:peptide-binding protein [Elusimicrobiota bacterium]